MASTVWKGFLSFGVVTIPVKLSVAARSESISFNQIHKPCGSRINQQLVCKACDRVVERTEIIKGYEEAKDKYLLIEPSEIEAIAPQSSTAMEIVQFVEAHEVDPIYFESSYYLEPEKVGRVAYKLLLEAMRKSERIAVAKLAMHQPEHAVLIRPRGPGLSLHTMFYENEIRAQELNLSDVALTSEHLQLAEQLMTSMLKPFDPLEFRDEYQAKLLEMLEAKRQGKPITVVPARAAAPVVDILAALQQSLAKKPPVQAESAVQAPAEKAAETTVSPNSGGGRERGKAMEVEIYELKPAPGGGGLRFLLRSPGAVAVSLCFLYWADSRKRQKGMDSGVCWRLGGLRDLPPAHRSEPAHGVG